MLLFFTTAPVPVTFEFIDPVPWRSDKSWEPVNHYVIAVIHVSDPWDMLNNFCFHVYAQKSLFIGENDNVYFWTSAAAAAPLPVSLEFIELVPS